MSRKSLFGIIIGVLFFGAILLSIETSVSLWQALLGFLIAWVLSLGFANTRNAFFLLVMTLIFFADHLFLYQVRLVRHLFRWHGRGRHRPFYALWLDYHP